MIDNQSILRVKGERRAYVLLLFLVFFFLYLLFELNFYLLGLSLFLGLLYIRLLQAQQLGNSIRVTETQIKEIYSIVETCSKRLKFKKIPYVYINQNPVLNAYSMGFKSPYIIVLNSGLVENLTKKELAFVIGHELGHIKFFHTLLISIISPIGRNIVFLDFLSGFWGRKTEYTCDRAGLIACGDLKSSISALLKVSCGPKIASLIDMEYLFEQLQEINTNKLNYLGELLTNHPYIVNRIHRIIKFSSIYNINVCEKCGSISKRGSKFCFSCGKELE